MHTDGKSVIRLLSESTPRPDAVPTAVSYTHLNLEQLIILGHGAVRVSAKSFHDEVFGTNEEIRRILQENNRKNR